MSTVFSRPLEDIVRERKSVRTYSKQQIKEETKEQLKSYLDSLYNPFSTKVSFIFLESRNISDDLQLGTYGMIKGASNYIGATVDDADFNLEAVGYEFEKLILFAVTLGLGTCWLGGTFTRNEFVKAMKIRDNVIFPAISPIGYAEKKRLAESLVRLVTKADQRKSWDDLFYDGSFATPLTSIHAGEYAFALEMTRLAPSASNKQPWRIIKTDDSFHFYEFKLPGYSDKFSYDIQRIDMGIAACHFHLAAIEKKLKGEFKKMETPAIETPNNTHYAFSWVLA